jgi:hypothetical protein
MRVSYLLPVALIAAAACSSDPTGTDTPPPPPPPPPTVSHLLRLEVTSIVVREMCDGFPVDIDGGEWSHLLEARFPGETSSTIGGTANFPSASSKKSVGRGGTLALISAARVQSRVRNSVAGDKVTLTIRATEWDYDILGNNPFPDSRMNNRAATATFTFEDGVWPEQPAGKLTLQNTSSCIVDVNYKFEAVQQ